MSHRTRLCRRARSEHLRWNIRDHARDHCIQGSGSLTSSHPLPAEILEEAYELALQADLSGEVPVGALVVELSTLKIVGRGKNEIISRKDPTAHAELLAIREACAHFQSERMLPSVLVSTLEPCTLCTGAILFARVAEVQYFTPVLSGAGIVRLLDQFG
ncbi:MAG TPA: nucleoside deaminase, partial [Leptospiraceae bacterium]|nr:nucleoside deaminase [Leptospiraceae bacterium]